MSIVTLLKTMLQAPERAPSDLELSDLGLSRADFDRLTSSKDDTRARMEVLAARFGISPEMIDADRGLALEIAERCGHCLNAKICQNAIDLGVEMDTALCPNAKLYAEMSAA